MGEWAVKTRQSLEEDEEASRNYVHKRRKRDQGRGKSWEWRREEWKHEKWKWENENEKRKASVRCEKAVVERVWYVK